MICLTTVLLVGSGLLAYNALLAVNAQSHQTKAVNAAALTAAYDLGRVVINDPNLGFVGLLDKAPIGGNLVAKDSYAMPVRSINSLLATVRLDLIVADALQTKTMKELAANDYKNILAAQSSLIKAMNASLTAGVSKPTDAYGNEVDAYGDALKVYSANGGIVSNKSSLRLTLGWCPGLSSNVSIPQPTQYANVTEADCSAGCYMAYINLPYDNYDFVLAALDSQQPSLINGANFSIVQGTMPNSVFDVVRAEGDETDKLLGLFGSPGSVTVHGTSYAIPGGPTTAALTAGALVLTFPDGNIPEILSVQNLFVDPSIASSPMTFGQAQGGDYPIDSGSKLSFPATSLPVSIGKNPSLSTCCEMALYDWIRRAGYTANASSILNIMKAPLSPLPDTLSPFMNVFTFASDGTVSNQFLQLEQNYCQSSDAQPYGQPQGWGNGRANTIQSPTRAQVYGVIVQDNVRQPGTTKGGKHGGEPLVDIRLARNPPFPDPNFTNGRNQFTGTSYAGGWNPSGPPGTNLGWGGRAGGWAYGKWFVPLMDESQGWTGLNPCQGGDNTPDSLAPQPVASSPGQQRPTYHATGLSVEIAFHQVITCLCKTNGASPPPPEYYGIP